MTRPGSCGFALTLAVALVAGVADAYERYNDGCQGCHGKFTSDVSPQGTVFPSGNKHTMHRSSQYMNTECDLCHTTGDGNNPFIGSSDGTTNNPGLGCTGCHGRAEDAGHDGISNGLGAGLRQHHDNAGVDDCVYCHEDASSATYTPVGENVTPVYYGTADTNADQPCNGVAQAEVNENWSADTAFIGLDNDGNLDYDQNDVVCLPEPGRVLLGAVALGLLGVLARRARDRRPERRGRRTGPGWTWR